MNQEQNNENNINNSVMPNNQNYQQNLYNNGQPFINQSQAVSNYVQPLNQSNISNSMQQPNQMNVSNSMQQPNQMNVSNSMQQTMNSSVGGVNVNNQNLSNGTSKSKKTGLIIGIIVTIILVTIIVGVLVFSKKDKTSILENPVSNSKNNSDISEISVSKKDIVVLTKKGDLYYMGDTFSLLSDSDEDSFYNLEKKSSNVEKFYNNSAAVYYIDTEGDLYYYGSSYNVGSSDEIKKDYSEVKDINVYMNFCGYVIKNNGELYVKNNSYGNSYCGLGKTYNEFTKVAEDVKQTIAYGYYGGYINNKNELYISISNTEFKKILDNVSSVSSYSYKAFLILTLDNKLYFYHDRNWQDETGYELNLLSENVIELGDNYFKKSNGEYNIFSSQSSLAFVKDDSISSINGEQNIYYGILDLSDISKILYYNDYNEKSLIYLSKDNKVVMLGDDEKKVVEYSINSMKEILQFVNRK